MKHCFLSIENLVSAYINTPESRVSDIRRLQTSLIMFLFSGLVGFKMKTVCIAVFIVFLLSTTSTAQIATVRYKPSKYDEQPDGDLVEGKAKYSNRLWLVFSDRDNNDVYGSSSQVAPVVNTAGYMDKFYVTGESGDFLELYKLKDEIGTKMTGPKGTTQLVTNKAERVGWIKKENLLLWSRCLVNKQTGFSEKAMAVFSSKNLNKEFTNDKGLKRYNSPTGDEGVGTIINIFNLLYVYKKSGSKVLIGKRSKTQQYDAERDILGWVDTSFLQLWPDRVCIEPNHDAEAVKARKDASVKASLFYSKNEALAWKEGKAAQPIWDDDSYEKPWLPSQLRFPVFDQVEINGNTLIKTGFFTSLLTEDTVTPKQVNPVVKNYLNRLGGAVADSDLVSKFKGRNVQFFISAWTTQNVSRLPNDESVFKYVLYLYEEELFDLIDHLFKLTAGDVPPSELRNKLYETYESLAQVYFDREIAGDKKFIRKIAITQIIDRITGVPSRSQLLKTVKIADIKDRAKVSDPQIEEIVTNIRKSYEALRTAKQDVRGEIRYPTNDGAFYWIPEDYLP